MGELAFILILYALAMLVLVGEIFIPSHGLLSILGLVILVIALVKTFGINETAGYVAVLACVVILPVAAFVAVKVWPHTPLGRAISPDNRQFTTQDAGVDVDSMQAMVGRTGKVVSPLRPVGTCDIGGRRFQCVAEMGMIEAKAEVEVVGVKGMCLAVVKKEA